MEHARRRVAPVVLLYLGAAWVLLQVANTLEEALELPDWVLAPYLALGAAQGVDEVGEFVDVVLLHPDAERAMANRERLERNLAEGEALFGPLRWSERVLLDSVEIVDHRLVARLRPVDGIGSPWRVLMDSIIRRDTLLAFG